MKESGYAKLIPQEFETKLVKYLNTLGNNTPELYLYYLTQKKNQAKHKYHNHFTAQGKTLKQYRDSDFEFLASFSKE